MRQATIQPLRFFSVYQRVKHVDLDEKCVRQNPREVTTKFGKVIYSFFHKDFPEAEAVLAKWITYLDEMAYYGPDDRLLPATVVSAKGTDGFEATGFERRHWSTTEPIRKIVNAPITAAGLEPAHARAPHFPQLQERR